MIGSKGLVDLLYCYTIYDIFCLLKDVFNLYIDYFSDTGIMVLVMPLLVSTWVSLSG